MVLAQVRGVHAPRNNRAVRGAWFLEDAGRRRNNNRTNDSRKIPARYIAATGQNSGNVEIVHLPDGHNDIRNYVAGESFPHPEEPDKGYKLLADLWFAYVPHLFVGTSENPLSICSETAHGYVSCRWLSYVFR